MKRRSLQISLFTAAIVAIAACVTINVYFPAAEIKDLSRKIEDEVQKEAAKDAAASGQAPAPSGTTEPAPSPAPPGEKPQTMGASVFDLIVGATPAYAQAGSVPAPEVTSPAIRKIIESRGARVNDLAKYFDAGVIGESNQALVDVRKLDALDDLKARAEVQRLVKAENADREELFREIAAAKKVDLAQLPKIRETYAATLRERARPGTWVQAADGTWKQK